MKNQKNAILYLILFTSFLPCKSQDNKTMQISGSVRKPVQFSSQDLFISGENNVNEYRIPSIVVTEKGTLIAVCWARNNKIDLVMKKSSDSGKTWTKSKVIVGFPENAVKGYYGAADPSMVVDKHTGTIWLSYDYVIPDPQGDLGRIVRVHLIKSDDEGTTWSAPVDLSYLTNGKDFWLHNGPGVGLYKEGVIVFPMYAPERGSFEGKGAQQTVLVFSKDHGKTWVLRNGVGEYNPEPQIVSLTGGRIMANTRRPKGNGCRQVAITNDLGKTWSEVYNDSVLIEPGCQGSLINYNYNNLSLLVFSNPADKKERKNMTVRVSSDEGKNWQKEIPVYNGSSGYSCLVQLANGNVGLFYEADGKRLVFIEIPYKELF
jgi:sialidase-1